MNTNTMELNLNEMATVTGYGDTLDHVAGALSVGTAGMMICSGIGSIAGAPGVVIGAVAGAAVGGSVGGIYGFSRIKKWVREHLPNPNR